MTTTRSPTPDYIDAANAALDLRGLASAFVPFDGLDFLQARLTLSKQAAKGIESNGVNGSHKALSV